MIEDAVEMTPEQTPDMTLAEFSQILLEIRDQPPWRVQADKEMDYKDGNQLSSDLLSRMKELGVPPATMPLIGLSVESALGYEAKQRKDWRVIPDNDVEGQDVADAFNFKLNQAERRSRADKACSDAFESQYSVGVGWVEVTKEQDPFKYPYRCRAIHRNEMFWDWNGYLKSPMGEEASWLVRKNWVNKDVLKLTFPEHADIIEHSGSGWSNFDVMQLDGGRSTELSRAQDVERGWTIEEQEWRNTALKRVMLFEVWYRRWERVIVLKHSDGRTEELDEANETQLQALVNGAEPVHAVVGKVRRAWFAGPHKLADDKSPYRHNHFGYVPFWGWKEDRTGTPYGRIRAMMYMQDNINASLSKIRWGLSSTVTKRTKGAYTGTATQLRNQVSRVDADIVLDQAHMALPGALFEIDRNFQLNEQQYKMYVDAVASINKLGGLSDEFLGQGGQAQSGAQQAQTIEQTSVGLANIMDNFNESRSQVGELLLSMIVQDSIGKREEVNIDGGALRDDRTIVLNDPYMDELGNEGMNNDVSRVMLKVNLEDVPSTSSYRNQQLAAFSEAFKSTTPDYQQLMMPHMINLMDIPNKQEIIQAMKEKTAQPSPEQQQLQAKVQELEVKRMLAEAQVKLVEAQAVKTGTESQYSAMQAGQVIATMPQVAPVADVVMQNAGFVPIPGGVDPNFPQPEGIPVVEPDINQNTSPQLPPVPESPLHGIETQRITDNLPRE
jgi:hypothetical protein